MNQSVIELWQKFKMANQINHDRFTAWSFGNSSAMADELLSLVLSGKKIGTSSLHVLYDLEKQPHPKVGDYSVLLDGQDQGQAIIRTTLVDVIAYNRVTEVHGFLEGEGNRTLTYWKSVHRPFFKMELAKYGQPFTEDLLVVYELFEVVYY